MNALYTSLMARVYYYNYSRLALQKSMAVINYVTKSNIAIKPSVK